MPSEDQASSLGPLPAAIYGAAGVRLPALIDKPVRFVGGLSKAGALGKRLHSEPRREYPLRSHRRLDALADGLS